MSNVSTGCKSEPPYMISMRSDKAHSCCTTHAHVLPTISSFILWRDLGRHMGIFQISDSALSTYSDVTDKNQAYQICAALSIQILGFGLAGMIRRFLIYPCEMVFFFTLGQGALNNALHNENNSHVPGWNMSRFKFFFIVFGAMFVSVVPTLWSRRPGLL
jgi:hypothetical protein